MKLTAARRASMPRSSFALPGHRFPISDPTHARLAISGATRARRVGNITSSQEASIKSQARAKLGHPHKNLGSYLHPKGGYR